MLFLLIEDFLPNIFKSIAHTILTFLSANEWLVSAKIATTEYDILFCPRKRAVNYRSAKILHHPGYSGLKKLQIPGSDQRVQALLSHNKFR